MCIGMYCSEDKASFTEKKKKVNNSFSCREVTHHELKMQQCLYCQWHQFLVSFLHYHHRHHHHPTGLLHPDLAVHLESTCPWESLKQSQYHGPDGSKHDNENEIGEERVHN